MPPELLRNLQLLYQPLSFSDQSRPWTYPYLTEFQLAKDVTKKLKIYNFWFPLIKYFVYLYPNDDTNHMQYLLYHSFQYYTFSRFYKL